MGKHDIICWGDDMPFQFKKKYGQNFISDKGLLEKIVRSTGILPNSLILEVGPGNGNLTEFLSNTGNQVLCYEIDTDLKPILEERFQNKKVDFIFGDFLKQNVLEDIKKYSYDHLYFVSNLPYYITTPIITKFIDEKIPVEKMTVMVQKEVAERFQAKIGTKDYNSLTIYLNYSFEVRKLFDVSRKVFHPEPNVDSAVVLFTRRETKEQVFDEPFFFQLLRDAFQFKRKNLRNNLKTYDLSTIESVLKEYHFDLSVRAEQLNLSIFVAIANKLVEKL